MSLVPPPNVPSGANSMSTTAFPALLGPYPNVQPFSYPDGLTFQKLFESYRAWLLGNLVPHVDAQSDAMIAAYNEASAALDSAMSDYTAGIITDRTAFEQVVTIIQNATVAARNAAQAAEAESKAARDKSQEWAAGTQALQETAVATIIGDPASVARDTLSGLYAPTARRFVVFGDSWTTKLYPTADPLPNQAVAKLGGTIVKNYGVGGAIIGPTTQNTGNATDAQVTTAQNDASYNKSRITDVLVIAGVNNIGGYLPNVDQARGHFQGIANLYPNARLWFVTDSKRAINNAGDNDPWRWYNRFFEAAALAGFETADWSAMWHWGALRDAPAPYWDAATTDSSRHPSAAGFAAIASRLAAFLTGGQSWRPYFKVATSLHANAQALMTAAGSASVPVISTDNTVVDGSMLRLNVSIGNMDPLSAVATTAYQPILQIPTAYMPIGDYLNYPVGARLSASAMDWSHSMRVNADGPGVVSLDPWVLNNHVGYFVIKADLPLTTVKTAD